MMSAPANPSFTRRHWLWHCALLAVAAVLLPVLSGADSATHWTYRRFSVDATTVPATENLAALRAATAEQIDLVSAVGLPSTMLTFMQGVPLHLVPPRPDGSPGAYNPEQRTVEITTDVLAFAHHAVLLHELLHALHFQILPDGVENRDIALYLERARAKGVYSEGAYLLTNRTEFFACTATIYLYGVSGKEPNTRDRLRTSQPRYFEYLTNLFGPEAGRYAGSLTTGPALAPPEAPASDPVPSR